MCAADVREQYEEEQTAHYNKGMDFIERLSVLIIGPGLGDDPEVCLHRQCIQAYNGCTDNVKQRPRQ